MPFITKRHIPRRTFLKGAGVTLALPVLDAMVPASTLLAQTVAGQSPSRFVGMFYPHGMGPGHWEPAAEGPLPEDVVKRCDHVWQELRGPTPKYNR